MKFKRVFCSSKRILSTASATWARLFLLMRLTHCCGIKLVSAFSHRSASVVEFWLKQQTDPTCSVGLSAGRQNPPFSPSKLESFFICSQTDLDQPTAFTTKCYWFNIQHNVLNVVFTLWPSDLNTKGRKQMRYFTSKRGKYVVGPSLLLYEVIIVSLKWLQKSQLLKEKKHEQIKNIYIYNFSWKWKKC